MASRLIGSDAQNKIENLSGLALRGGENPYQELIDACDGSKSNIQAIYSSHREERNRQQRDKFLSPDFQELIIDPILLRLENPTIEPGFRDDRHCLTLWARPPEHILQLAAHLQSLLKEVAPDMWFMPTHCMHLTALEISHSKMPSEMTAIVKGMRDAIPTLANVTAVPGKRPRLVKPLLSYDLAAVAVSFLPATNEPVVSPPAVPETTEEYLARPPNATLHREAYEDDYTYHHLRRDLLNLAKTTKVKITTRYVVPSAHITLGRFLIQDNHATEAQRAAWIEKIDSINKWLEAEVWSKAAGQFLGEWCIGQEKGLEAHTGAVWYGGGRVIMMGEGY